jgi:hypothetical protein
LNGAKLRGEIIDSVPFGDSSILSESLSREDGSIKPSKEASSVEGAVDTVDGVPKREKGILPCPVLAS